jgi:hypothetical protein
MLAELESLRAQISSLQREIVELKAENEYLHQRMGAFQEATSRARVYYENHHEDREYARILPHDEVRSLKDAIASGKKKKEM